MENIFTGKTVEEAVNAGLEELGLTAEDVDVEVLDEGKKRIIGSKPAQVKLTVREKKTDGERAVAFLEGLLPLLSIDAVATLKGEEEKIVIELTAPSAKNVIGRRGEIIDAVQTLAGAVANTGRKDYKRVVVDCENYREDREETLKRVANKLAAKAVRLGKRVRLEPMNPYERRIIHAALVDHPDVTTKSEGKEPQRFVVIIPKNLKPYERRNDRGDFRGGRNDRGGSRGKFNRDNREGGYRGNRNDRNHGKYGERKPYPKRELPAEGTPESSGTSFKRDGGASSGYRKGSFSGFFGTYLGKDTEENAAETPVVSPTETGSGDEE